MADEPQAPETDDVDAPDASPEPSRAPASLAEKLSSLLDGSSPPRQPSPRRRENGPVIYPDAEVLTRPLDMPHNVRLGIAGAMAAAAIIGAVFLGWYFDGVANEPKRQQEAVTEALSKDIPYDLPALYPLMPLEDASILSTLQESGLSLYEMPAKEGSSVYQLIKLPQDVSTVDAGALYLAGMSNISAADAARLLNGSWDLQVDRANGTNMVLHYADFRSGTVDAAVQSALAAEGLTDASIEDSGEDTAGNTYVMGTISGDAGTYSWRVSALPLSEIYSIKGLPDNAVYVGIRMTS